MKSVNTSSISLHYLYFSLNDHALPAEFVEAWDDLVPDQYQTDRKYPRQRRYCRFTYDQVNNVLLLEPHSPYFQSTENNKLYGGIARDFAPVDSTMIDAQTTLNDILRYNLRVLSLPYNNIVINCHLVRIVAGPGEIGEPTPEGIHHDGFDYISIHMINKRNCEGGVTTVYSNNDEPLLHIELQNPLDSLILNDKLYKHATTPIQPKGALGTRDVLLCSYHNAQN